MDLEAELGKTLLIRGNRKIKLTEDGMFLRKRAQEIIELADKTEASFKSEDEFISGEVYIGGGETDAFQYIAKHFCVCVRIILKFISIYTAAMVKT